jgi:hypothetical protein
MTRYNVLLHRQQTEYLAACYAPTGSGIRTTLQAEDACSWVLPETASRVARHISETLGVEVSIKTCAA